MVAAVRTLRWSFTAEAGTAGAPAYGRRLLYDYHHDQISCPCPGRPGVLRAGAAGISRVPGRVLLPGQPIPDIGPWIREMAASHDAFASQLAQRQRLAREGDQGVAGLGQAPWPWASPGEEPLLQPPKPMIRPSARVMDRLAQRDADLEATV